jgi:hypothetical protein
LIKNPVQQQSIYDSQAMIAYANAIEHQCFEEYHSLPRRIVIVAFGPDRSATPSQWTGHKINELYGDPERQWLMPQPADAQRVDLAKTTPLTAQAP